jgi:diadenosine tetraphosphate (Ap4A) HIT family hydrolase
MSRSSDFILDARLEADTRPVASLGLCDVRLMNDARFPWLVLVPRRHGLAEIIDLTADEQTTLWQEVNRAAAALRAVAPCDKLNLGALGNIVRQLHVHIVARCEGDAAWPGPVWGSGQAVPYAEASLSARRDALRQAFANSAA